MNFRINQLIVVSSMLLASVPNHVSIQGTEIGNVGLTETKVAPAYLSRAGSRAQAFSAAAIPPLCPQLSIKFRCPPIPHPPIPRPPIIQRAEG